MSNCLACLPSVARALNVLAVRLHELSVGGGLTRGGHSVLTELRPWPRMLDGVNPRVPPGAVLSRVLRAQDHVLAQLDGTLAYDPQLLVMALQQIGDGAMDWTAPARQLAARLQLELPDAPLAWGLRHVREVAWHVVQQRGRGERRG